MKGLLKLILTAVIAAAIAFTLISYRGSIGGSEMKPSVLARVQQSGILRCGYNTEAPSLMVDPNTKKISGISADIVERMATLLGWKVEWTEQVGWSEMTAGLAADRYDLVCVGKWVFASETRGGAFTMPLFYTAVHAYGRADETRFDDKLSILDDPQYKIATIDGEFNDYAARDKFPHAQRVEMPALTDPGMLILNVTTHKADVVFLAAAQAEDYMKQHPGGLKRLTREPVVVFDTALMFKSGEAALEEALNAALRQMHSDGFIETTLKKYEASPDAYLHLARPYALP